MNDRNLFDELSGLFQRVEPAEGFLDAGELQNLADDLKQRFDSDYQRVSDMRELLFGEEVDDYGVKIAALFETWDKEQGGPMLPALIAQCIDIFELNPDEALTRALFVAAVLAEYPNDLQYHGNEHYRKVMCHAIRMVATHNERFKGSFKALDEERICILLISGCIHDLGHQGGDNLRDSVYAPGAMEQRSFDIARPYFEALDLEPDVMGQIETIIFCTDITFFAGDNSPCVRLKKIYKHYFWGDDRDDVSMMMMGKLGRFDDNPQLALMAMMLHEADVASSAGLTYEQTIRETIDIMEERGVTNAGPQTVLAFLREQLGQSMFTEAGKRIFGQSMNGIINRAEEDIENGVQTYYE